MIQLDLLTYTLTEPELSPRDPPPPPPQATPPPDRLLDWLYGCISYHRQLQIRMMDKGIAEKLKADPHPTRIGVLKQMVGRSQVEVDRLMERIKQLEGDRL